MGGSPFNLSFERIEDEFRTPRKFNPCFHWKYLGFYNGLLYGFPSGGGVQVTNWVFSTDGCPTNIIGFCQSKALSDTNFNLSFQDDNDFELLSLIAELDDLLATFTWNFWKQISYGSANWGVLPLISDIKSLISSLNNFYSRAFERDLTKYANSRYAKSKSFSYSGSTLPTNPNISCNWTLSGTLRLNGYTNIVIPSPSAQITALQIFADELGFHPDLRTIWDLLPLSFVVDYFLPVGDLIESLHPRGWFNPRITFDGACSFKGVVYHDAPHTFDRVRTSPTLPCRFYRRWHQRFTSGTRQTPQVDFKLPSLRELFNTWYVTNHGKLGGLKF